MNFAGASSTSSSADLGGSSTPPALTSTSPAADLGGSSTSPAAERPSRKRRNFDLNGGTPVARNTRSRYSNQPRRCLNELSLQQGLRDGAKMDKILMYIPKSFYHNRKMQFHLGTKSQETKLLTELDFKALDHMLCLALGYTEGLPSKGRSTKFDHLQGLHLDIDKWQERLLQNDGSGWAYPIPPALWEFHFPGGVTWDDDYHGGDTTDTDACDLESMSRRMLAARDAADAVSRANNISGCPSMLGQMMQGSPVMVRRNHPDQRGNQHFDRTIYYGDEISETDEGDEADVDDEGDEADVDDEVPATPPLHRPRHRGTPASAEHMLPMPPLEPLSPPLSPLVPVRLFAADAVEISETDEDDIRRREVIVISDSDTTDIEISETSDVDLGIQCAQAQPTCYYPVDEYSLSDVE